MNKPPFAIPGEAAISMRTAIAFAALITTGCTIQPEQFIGPHGRTAYWIDCHNNLLRCHRTARELCPNGFDVAALSPRTVRIPARIAQIEGVGHVPVEPVGEAHTILMAVECRGGQDDE